MSTTRMAVLEGMMEVKVGFLKRRPECGRYESTGLVEIGRAGRTVAPPY